MNKSKEMEVSIIGYSGHSYVAIEILRLMGYGVNSYFEKTEKYVNPFGLHYKGYERHSVEVLKERSVFVSVGDNKMRSNIFHFLKENEILFVNAIHPKSQISYHASVGGNVMVSAGVVVNPLAKIANGVILNTGSIIEHECMIDEFTHIAPGAVLNGNVEIGKRTFVGANSVIKQGVKIGSDVLIGAGTVVIRDVPDNKKIVGNPQRNL